MDDTFTMRPRPCARICGRTAFIIRITPEDVHVDDLLVLYDRELLGGTCGADARVVDQDVQPAEATDHLLDHRSHRGVTRHVQAHEGQTLAAGEPDAARLVPTTWNPASTRRRATS